MVDLSATLVAFGTGAEDRITSALVTISDPKQHGQVYAGLAPNRWLNGLSGCASPRMEDTNHRPAPLEPLGLLNDPSVTANAALPFAEAGYHRVHALGPFQTERGNDAAQTDSLIVASEARGDLWTTLGWAEIGIENRIAVKFKIPASLAGAVFLPHDLGVG
jgi:hypothetical protein